MAESAETRLAAPGRRTARDAYGRLLRNHQSVSGTTVHGWPAAVFGLPFAGVGVWVALIGANVVPVSPSSIHAPRWVLVLVGVVFAGAGLFLMVHGLRGVVAEARRRRLAVTHADEPWMADYRWRPDGERGRLGASLVKHFVGVLFLLLFLAPFNWWAFTTGGAGPLMVKIIVGLFDLILLLVVGHLVYRVVQRLRYGRARLRYRQFPVHPGELIDAELTVPNGIERFDKLTLTLRRVEERYEISGSGKNRKKVVNCYEIYREAITIDTPGELERTGTMPITFLVPEDAPATELSARPAKWWEIEAEAETPGVDFREVFLAPVYRQA